MADPLFTRAALIAGLCAASLSDVARADTLDCRFALECVERDACLATANALSVTYVPKSIGPDASIGRATVSDISGTTDAVSGARDGTVQVQSGGIEFGQRAVLIADLSSAARYAILSGAAPMIITCHGTCEVQP